MKKIIVLSLIAIFLAGILLWLPKKQCQKKETQHIIKVGITDDYPPFVYLENNKIVGFDVDLINIIAQKLGKEIQFTNMAFNVLISGLQQGKIDMIIGGLTPDPERTKHAFFTTSYLTNDPLVIISLPPNNLQTTQDLHDKTVIVNEGYTADLFMSKIKGPILKRLPSVTDAIMSLKAGKGDAFVSALTTINPYLKKHGKENFNIYPISNAMEEYAFVVSKKQPQLYEEIEKALNEIIKNGTIEKFKEKWKLYD